MVSLSKGLEEIAQKKLAAGEDYVQRLIKHEEEKNLLVTLCSGIQIARIIISPSLRHGQE